MIAHSIKQCKTDSREMTNNNGIAFLAQYPAMGTGKWAPAPKPVRKWPSQTENFFWKKFYKGLQYLQKQ
jgi:hypothetical protein